MKKSEKGFSVIETLIVLIVVAFVGATGWMVYKNHHKAGLASTSNSANISKPPHCRRRCPVPSRR